MPDKGYDYDAFFSYKRHPLTDDWYEELRKRIEIFAATQLGKPVSIFLDREDIKLGNQWLSRLEYALTHSLCVICMWSPLYFFSRYCVSEWITFEDRSQETGIDLIIPAVIFKGDNWDNIPAQAKQRQAADLSGYYSTIRAFWQSARAVDLEENGIKPLSQALVAAIRSAPHYLDTFSVREAIDSDLIPIAQIQRPSRADNGA